MDCLVFVVDVLVGIGYVEDLIYDYMGILFGVVFCDLVVIGDQDECLIVFLLFVIV